MGVAELTDGEIIIYSHLIIYGNASSASLAELMREEIETMWNEPLNNIRFKISAAWEPSIKDIDIYQNLDPRNNYFRIEDFAMGNISFVDGLGCNSGYFLLENLYKGSTTAAHEYGHTLGLDHPDDLDIRGKGVPGIMYPRGTLVDPQYQYDPDMPAGAKGGTLYPIYRKVLQEDIQKLNLEKLHFQNNQATLGEFTNIWHPDHREL